MLYTESINLVTYKRLNVRVQREGLRLHKIGRMRSNIIKFSEEAFRSGMFARNVN